jgi:hypothetical protein
VPLEKRTRVEIFLPIRTESADYQTITDLLAEELAFSRGGSTLTSPFTGLYVSSSRGDVVRDDIHVLFCDFDLDTDKPEHFVKLTSYLDEVRALLMDALNEEEVWVVYHPVTRVTTDDTEQGAKNQ